MIYCYNYLEKVQTKRNLTNCYVDILETLETKKKKKKKN